MSGLGNKIKLLGDKTGKIVELIFQGGRTRETISSLEALPSDQPIKYVSEFLKEGENFNMNVLGSLGTPVVFQKVFSTNQIGFMEKIVLQLRDGGKADLDDFGSGPGLTNGLFFEIQTGGQITSSFNVKTNGDLISAADDIFEITQFTGAEITVYTFDFIKNISFNHNDNNDFIRVSIRDDLRAIEGLIIAFKRWEVI